MAQRRGRAGFSGTRETSRDMREGVQDEHFGLDEREYIKTRGGRATFNIFFFLLF
jgi:hypothetical protein